MNYLPINRFPSGPAYDNGGEPQFNCANKDCDYRAFTEDEMPQCIVCKKRFCVDGPEAGPGGCLRRFGSELFCPACAKCACEQPALISCDECGSLVCERHMAIDPLLNQCKDCRFSGPDPDDPPAEAYDPNDFADQVRS